MSWSRALVTGASRGIGAAFASALAARGSDLVLVARDIHALEDLATRLARDHGTDAEVLAADLTDPSTRASVEDRLGAETKPVDLLVNNAGFGSFGPFHEQDVDAQTAMVELMVTTVARLSHVAATTMRARKSGAILNVSSILGFQPGPRVATYAASKAFVRHLAEALHEELRRDGVQVMAVCPGFTRTDIFEGAGSEVRFVPSVLWMTPTEVAKRALADLEKGRAVSVPGLPYQGLAQASPRLPRTLVRRLGELLGRLG